MRQRQFSALTPLLSNGVSLRLAFPIERPEVRPNRVTKPNHGQTPVQDFARASCLRSGSFNLKLSANLLDPAP
jgi:hypothetical protein